MTMFSNCACCTPAPASTGLALGRRNFIAGGIAGLKGKTLEEVRISALEKKIGQQAMEIELHEKKDQFLRSRSGRTSK